MEGIFVPTSAQPVRSYDLAAEADRLAHAAERLNPADIGALLGFLGTWGRLGVGFGGYALYYELSAQGKRGPAPSQATLDAVRGHDSVAAVRAEILAWQRALRDLQRLQQRKGQATTEEWETLFEKLGPHLERMRPSVRWAPDTGAVPVWVVDTPADMLWAVLYDWATRGGRLHRCPRCDTLFTATRPRQKFCSVTCTNRASAAAWYRRRGRKQRRAKRHEKRD